MKKQYELMIVENREVSQETVEAVLKNKQLKIKGKCKHCSTHPSAKSHYRRMEALLESWMSSSKGQWLLEIRKKNISKTSAV